MLIARHFLAAATAIALLMCGATTARAQTSGLYVAGGGGIDFLRSANGTTDRGQGAKFSFETGWSTTAAIGYGFGNGLRVEGEFGYRRHAFDKADEDSGAGSVSSHSALINLLYDFTTGTTLTPYAGAGVGIARVRATDFFVPDNVAITGSDDVFTHQWIAGVAVEIADRWKLDLGYRYLLMTNPVFDLKDANGGQAGTSASFPHRHQVVLLQLRYEFGQRK